MPLPTPFFCCPSQLRKKSKRLTTTIAHLGREHREQQYVREWTKGTKVLRSHVPYGIAIRSRSLGDTHNRALSRAESQGFRVFSLNTILCCLNRFACLAHTSAGCCAHSHRVRESTAGEMTKSCAHGRISRGPLVPLYIPSLAPATRFSQPMLAPRRVPESLSSPRRGSDEKKRKGSVGRFRSTALRPWLEYTPPSRRDPFGATGLAPNRAPFCHFIPRSALRPCPSTGSGP